MKILIALIFAVFSAILPVSAQDSDNIEDSIYTPIKLESANDALSRALELTGFNDFMKVKASKSTIENYVNKIVIEKDSTPFLNGQIEGRELWRVRLNEVDIRPKYAKDHGYNLWRRKNFIVLLNPDTGQPLKIYSTPLSKDSVCVLRLSAKEAASELLSTTGGEEYHGFPTVPPKITFLEALHAAAGCVPLLANEIIGQYILYSRHGQNPFPVWCITSLGTPQVHYTSRRKQSLIKSENLLLDCSRCIVDAMTGEWLLATSIPCIRPKKSGE